jgi:hypothetical protein
MARKSVKLSEQYPEAYAKALEIVGRIRRDMKKKLSVSKSASELVQPLNDFKAK